MREDISILRLYLMRFVYLGNLVFLGLNAWPEVIHHVGTWDPIRGAAFSFWAALSALSALGLRYPLKMLPVLLLQLLYKSIWLIAIALPQWSALQASSLTMVMLAGIAADLLVIPWPYVIAQYLTKGGDRWRSLRPGQSSPAALTRR